MKNSFAYNYVVFGNDGSLMRTAYYDCKKCKQTRYIEMLDVKSRILNFLFKCHTSNKMNRYFKLPFRNIWNRLSFKNTFKNNLPICFILFGNDKRRVDNGLIEYLRKKYVGCCIVSFCQDLIRTYGNEFGKNRNKYDFIFSFDHGDVKNYGLLYYPLVYSRISIPHPEAKYKSDVYFLGKAKDRLDQILQIYKHLSDIGLNCQFFITGVDKLSQKYAERIHYCNGLSYEENIKYVMATKCLLEIMQGGGEGYTIRYAEALTYRKKMITNNSMIKTAPFYNDGFVCSFNKPDDIDKEFLHKPLHLDSDSYNSLSPLVFFKHIDNIISSCN